MTLPAASIIYLIWLRSRWVVAACAAYLAALAALFRSLPAMPREASLCLAIPLGVGMGRLLSAFLAGDSNLSSTRSGFPSHLLVRPAATVWLILWPMLAGALALGLFWIAVASGMLQVSKHELPALWPAGLLIASILWLQAMSWSPVPWGMMRAIGVVTSLMAIWVTAWIARAAAAPGWTLAIFAVVASGGAFATAVWGVGAARRGEGEEWPRSIARPISYFSSIRARSASPRSFRSGLSAQVWLENRRNLLGIVLLGLVILLTSLPLMLRAGYSPAHSPLVFAPAVPPWVVHLFMTLSLPMFMGMVFGSLSGRFDPWQPTSKMPPFLAIRALGSSEFVVAKLVSAAVLTTAMVSVTLLAIVIECFIVHPDGGHRSVAASVMTLITPKQVLTALGLLLGLWLLTWRNLVVGMIWGLCGRDAIAVTMTIVSSALLGLGIFAAAWISLNERLTSALIKTAIAVLPLCVGALAVMKLLLILVIARLLRKERLADAQTIALCIVGWALVVLVLSAALQHVRARFGLAQVWLLPAMVVLTVPLVRLLLSPLALRWNRHR